MTGDTRTSSVASLRSRLVPEVELTVAQDAAIRALLVEAFPRHATTFTASSYWGSRPEYRLWLETPEGDLAARLSFEPRVIGAGDVEVLVAGVGEVAAHPHWRGRGVGRRLMTELQAILRDVVPVAFGYLGCLETVAGFYANVGWHRLSQPARSINADTGAEEDEDGPQFILPAREPVERWPASGLIDLRGMPW